MLSGRTRTEVRVSFGIDTVIDAVKRAQKKYAEKLPKMQQERLRLLNRFANAMARLDPSSPVEKYEETIKAFESISHGYDYHDHSKSYEDTLTFLTTAQAAGAATVDLSQEEFKGLERDDSALQHVISALKTLAKVDAATRHLGGERPGTSALDLTDL